MTRIERAARAYYARHEATVNAYDLGFKQPPWQDLSEEERDTWRDLVPEILAAAYPELMADPPTSWLAPWEANEVVDRWLIPEDWEELRDAHLKEMAK